MVAMKKSVAAMKSKKVIVKGRNSEISPLTGKPKRVRQDRGREAAKLAAKMSKETWLKYQTEAYKNAWPKPSYMAEPRESVYVRDGDAWTLFQSIDHNEDFKINLEEFLNGCVELRGFAKAVDLFALRTQVAKVREELKTISQVLSTGTLRPPVATHLSL